MYFSPKSGFPIQCRSSVFGLGALLAFLGSPQIREKYFSGNYYVKFGHFLAKIV